MVDTDSVPANTSTGLIFISVQMSLIKGVQRFLPTLRLGCCLYHNAIVREVSRVILAEYCLTSWVLVIVIRLDS